MGCSEISCGELLDCFIREFEARHWEQARAEAVAIMAELLNCNRLQVQVNRQQIISGALHEEARQIMQRRLNNEPWQYIFQRAYFRDLTLKVSPAVLIPRPETELLVDWCLEFLPDNGSLLDLGTGSGAIALSVASERNDAQVTACDISSEALCIARSNGQNIAPGRVEWLQSDLFKALAGRKFDIIAANLPYVTENEHGDLSPEVRDFEPELALVSGQDGLDLIRKTVAQAAGYLNLRGSIILEMSEWQTPLVADIMAADIEFCAVEILRDYTGRSRFVAARKRNMELPG